MSSIDLVPEERATERIKEVFEGIGETLAIDFVSNLYRVTAPDPVFLEAKWDQKRTVVGEKVRWID